MHIPFSFVLDSVSYVTAAGAHTINDGALICMHKTVGAASTVNLPTGYRGRFEWIKDALGDAATNNITVVPAGVETIDGAASYVISENYGSVTLAHNGVEWNVVGAANPLSSTELGFLNGVTAGTATASKAVVLDSSGGIATITSATITTVTTSAVVNAGNETDTPGGSTAAAGSTTTDAGVLPAATSKIYPTTAADDTKGVRVHANDKVTGRLLLIGNGVSNKILKVYAPSGGTINGGSADAAFSSVSGKGVVICCLSGSGNTWLAW